MVVAYSIVILGIILLALIFLPITILVILYFVYKSKNKDLRGANTDKFVKFLKGIWNKVYQASKPGKSKPSVQDAEFREVKK